MILGIIIESPTRGATDPDFRHSKQAYPHWSRGAGGEQGALVCTCRYLMLSMEIGPDSSVYCVMAREPKVACNQIWGFIPQTGGEGMTLCHMMSVSKACLHHLLLCSQSVLTTLHIDPAVIVLQGFLLMESLLFIYMIKWEKTVFIDVYY